MMDRVDKWHRGARGTLAAMLVLAGASCGAPSGDPTLLIGPEDVPQLLDGRRLNLTVQDSLGRPRETSADVYDTNTRRIMEALRDECVAELELDRRFPGVASSPPGCGIAGAYHQQRLLCVGHQLLAMSGSPVPYDLIDHGTWDSVVPRERVGGGESDGPFAQPLCEPETTCDPAVTIHIDHETRTTLSLMALRHFQQAALLGAEIMDVSSCSEATAANRLDVAVTHPEPTTLAFVVATATADALQQLRETAERSSAAIAAAGDAQTSGSSAERARSRMVGLLNSRMAATRVWYTLQGASYDRPDDGDPTDTDETQRSTYPLVSPMSESAETREMERLFRQTRIRTDFKSTELRAGVQLDELRQALVVDAPEQYGTTAMASLSVTDFFTALGFRDALTSSAAVATRLEQEMVAFGRVRLAITGPTPTRYRGTSRPIAPAHPALAFARTAGATTLHRMAADPATGWLLRPISNTVHFDGTPAATAASFDPMAPSVTTVYGTASALETIDVVGSVLARALARTDVRHVPGGSTAATYDTARQALVRASTFARSVVPMRAEIGHGLGVTGGGVARERLRLMGATGGVGDYFVVVGAAGLQCALSGTIEGAPCNLADYRVTTTATTETNGALSGLGDQYFQWTIEPSHVPTMAGGSSTGIAAGTQFFVVRRQTSGGIGDSRTMAVASWQASIGPLSSGSYSAINQMPIGLLSHFLDRLRAAASEPSQPAQHCSGEMFDWDFPVEDDLVVEGQPAEATYFSEAEGDASAADQAGQALLAARAEAARYVDQARNTLSELCGVELPSDFTNASASIVTATAATSGSCTGGRVLSMGMCCPRDYHNVGGRCFPANPLASGVLSGTEEGRRISECIGNPETAFTVASLSSTEQCYWRVGDGSICTPLDGVSGEPASCPFDIPANGDCNSAVPMPGRPAGLVVEETMALGLVDRAPPPSEESLEAQCAAFSRFVSRRDVTADVRQMVFDAGWMEHDDLVRAIQTIEYREGPLDYDDFRIGGRPFVDFGDLVSGPSTGWPCATARADLPEPGVACAGDGAGFEYPLACGYHCGTYGTYEGNSRANSVGRFHAALSAVGRVIGAGWAERRLEYRADVSGAGVQRSLSGAAIADATLSYTNPFVYSVAAGDDERWPYGLAQRVYGVGRAPGFPLRENQEFFALGSRRVVELPPFSISVAGASPPSEGHACSTYDECQDVRREAAERRRRGYPGVQTDVGRSFDAWLYNVLNGWNRGRVSGGDTISGVYYRDLMRGLELACYAQMESGGYGGCSSAIDALPSITGPADLPTLTRAVDCMGDRIDGMAASLVMTDIPRSVAQQLSSGTVDEIYPESQGQYAVELAGLRGDLQSLVDPLGDVASAVRIIGPQMRAIDAALNTSGPAAQAARSAHISQVADQVARCATALAAAHPSLSQAIDRGFTGQHATQIAAAAATCVASVLAANAASDALTAQLVSIEASRQRNLTDALLAFNRAVDDIRHAESNLVRAYMAVQARLARIDSIRQQAREALSNYYLSGTDEADRELDVSAGIRQAYTGASVAYRLAFDRAVRSAYRARRALEQRIGHDLSEMSSPIGGVPAPSTWVDSLCLLQGVNPESGAMVGSGSASDYTGPWIGEYVSRLMELRTAYVQVNQFQEGRDTAVLSMRDQLLTEPVECTVPSTNLLTGSSALDTPPWSGECDAGWLCPTATMQRTGETTPFIESMRGAGSQAFVLTKDAAEGEAATCDGSRCRGYLEQAVTLEPGSYVLSWYEQLATPIAAPCTAMPTSGPRAQVRVRRMEESTDVALTGAAYLPASSEPQLDACRWRRVQATFEVDELFAGFLIGFRAPDPGAVVIASPQLDGFGVGVSESARPFAETDSEGQSLGMCPAEGIDFAGRWRRGCSRVCTTGVDCPADAPNGEDRCYHETTFTLTNDDLQFGRRLEGSTFAYGNFNYRIGTLALNLVGNMVRDCADASESCVGNGGLPYSLYHGGALYVRNESGEDFEAPIRQGRIEFASAQALEQRVTDPDGGLGPDFVRTELSRRPMAGTYTIRIWDDPALVWDRLEDVQVVVDYSYWTRLSRR